MKHTDKAPVMLISLIDPAKWEIND